MLILSRRVGEVLYVTDPEGNEVTFAILGFHRGKIRVGIKQPEGWNIQRAEQRHPDTASRAQVFLVGKDETT